MTVQRFFKPGYDSDTTVQLQRLSRTLWAFVRLDKSYSDIAPLLPTVVERLYTSIDYLSGLGNMQIKQLMDFFDYYRSNFSGAEWENKAQVFRLFLSLRMDQIPKPPITTTHREIGSVLDNCVKSTYEFMSAIAGNYADICFNDEKIAIIIKNSQDLREGLQSYNDFIQRKMNKCGYRVIQIHSIDWLLAYNKEKFIKTLLLDSGLEFKKPVTSLPPLKVYLLDGERVVVNQSGAKRKLDEVDGPHEESSPKFGRY